MEAIITNPIADLNITENAADSTINLFSNFDDPFTTGRIARFELDNPSFGGDGIIDVVLFDQQGEGAPVSVENFTNYAEDDDYVNSIIHRSVPGFIIQGGGFIVDGLEEIVTATPNSGAASVERVPTDAPIVNEFSPERSNLRGTIAFAKLGGDPNSATSQWFFNLADNSGNLDSQNGGFTVFGQVLSEEDLAIVDAIAGLPIVNGTTFFNQGAFTDLPLDLTNNDASVEDINGDEDLVRFRDITVSQVDELVFTIVSNTNPSLVNPAIANGSLVLDYLPDASGTAEIVVRATNLLGDTIEDTFSVTVSEDEQPDNTAPTLDDLEFEGLKDEEFVFTSTDFTTAFDDDDDDNLQSIKVLTLPAAGTLSLNGSSVIAGQSILLDQLGNLRFTPASNDSGFVTFTVTASDGLEESAPADITIDLLEISETPSFIFMNDPNQSFNPGQEISITNFARNINPGLSDEEELDFNIEFEGDDIFEETPTLDPATGTLRYTLAEDGLGTAIINVTLSDGETNTSTTQSFTIDSVASPVAILVTAEDDKVDGLVYDATAVAEGDNITINMTQGVQDLETEAEFDNLVGLYAVVGENGGIDTDGDGDADLLPSDEGYARAAIENRVENFSILAGAFGDPEFNTTVGDFREADVLLNGGKFYAPFVIAHGGDVGFEGFILNEEGEDSVFNNAAEFREDLVAYFAFVAANPDGVSHLQNRGNGIFGFEDLPGNLGRSDNDFNDAVFQLAFVA